MYIDYNKMKAYISFEEDGKTVEGMFEIVEQEKNYIKLKSKQNILILPYQKINKIKIKDMKGGKI